MDYNRAEDQRPRKPEEEFEAAISEALKKARVGRIGIYLVLGVVVLLWVASGMYVVQPSEQGVVRTFGKHTATTSPGINYRLPWPFQQVDVVDVQRIRRAEIGFRSAREAQGSAGQRILEEALMLTKDENIVEMGLLVQYRVSDAAAYVFKVQDPDSVLATTAEVALRSAVGQMPIDDAITERRADVQENTRLFMEILLNAYGSGIQITTVRLQAADAPDQVRDAFHEVVRAREDRERLVNESQAYREDILPRARGEARKIIEAATAFREERIRLARGDSERFLSILKEYQLAPGVTRERIHLEALENVLSKVDKVVINEGVRNSILPLLPLRGGGRVDQPERTILQQAPVQQQPPVQQQAPSKPQAPAQPQPTSQPGGR
ncbi:MAG: FtsH protease activity modulator HflK [Chloroflexi bacterium]|nr:FtsH protease activity modulator HflK [Chloroflexota bacterium]